MTGESDGRELSADRDLDGPILVPITTPSTRSTVTS